MDDGNGIGESFHQKPGTTCVIKVDMRQQDIIDLVATDSFFFKSRQQQRHGVVCAGIHESRPALVDHQMTGCETGPQIFRIYRADVVREIDDTRVQVHKQVTVGCNKQILQT